MPNQHGHAQDIVKIRSDVYVGSDETVGDAVAIDGNVIVLGHVTGDAVAVLGSVTVAPGGSVDGNIVAIGGSAVREEGGRVGGSVTAVGPGSWWQSPYVHTFGITSLRIWKGIASSLLFAVLALVITSLFPLRVRTVADVAMARPAVAALTGLIGLLALIPIAIFLLVTCIGIPLILVEFLIFGLAWMVGEVGMGLALGERCGEALHKPIASIALAAVIGTILIELVSIIPGGVLLAFILVLLGFGAVLLTGFGTRHDWLENRRGE
jgi:hypothetical protein